MPHPDSKLVTLTKRAIDHVGGRYTNTAFNKFRKIAGFDHFDGTKEQLNDLGLIIYQKKLISVISQPI